MDISNSLSLVKKKSSQVIQNTFFYRLLCILLDTIKKLKNSGYTIGTINIEIEFKPLMDTVIDKLDIKLNHKNSYDHVTESEINSRTIKDRVQYLYQSFTYYNIPKVMIIEMVLDQIRKIDDFPEKGRATEYYSPWLIMHQDKLE